MIEWSSCAEAPTLLAMKCVAARTREDADDIRFLCAHLGVTRAADALAIVESFFPAERLPVRSRLLLEELFGDDGG